MYTANADFSSVKEFPYNDNEYSVGHPALSKDGNILILHLICREDTEEPICTILLNLGMANGSGRLIWEKE